MRIRSYNNEAVLYLIPTPIGNMEDITLRAINILKEVDILLCEDTRVTGSLLHHLNIKKKLLACHDYNEDEVKDKVLDYLKDGKKVGLVTDRGTPIISDPGYKVVKYLINNGYPVVSLPGPTAFVPALTMSSLNPAPFLFYGFLNAKKSKRRKELEELSLFPYTLIFYEAPHRILDTLEDILSVFGNREISLAREISKIYEENIHGTISEVLKEVDSIKGEMVLVVSGCVLEEKQLSPEEIIDGLVEDGMSLNEAIKEAAHQLHLPKNDIYQLYHRKEK